MELKNQNNTTGSDKKVMKVSRLIWPLFLYYITSTVAQMVFLFYKLPDLLKGFILDNEGVLELLELTPKSLNKISVYELFPEFMLKIDQDVYVKFVNELLEFSIQNIAYITVLTGLLSIPLLWNMMRRDKKFNRIIITKDKKSLPIYAYLFIIIGGITLCIALNNIISFIQLSEISEAYQGTSQALYSIRFRYQLLGLGIIVPMAEELLYRGLLYSRFKVYISPGKAMFFTSFLFASLHGNIVQMLYAFIVGFTFAWLYEKFGNVWAPITAHCIMNLTSVCLTKGQIFDMIFKDNMVMAIITIVCATITSMMYVFIVNLESEEGR